ncbi:helix-turn-helix transcriptional regulator [Streptomyces niveus]
MDEHLAGLLGISLEDAGTRSALDDADAVMMLVKTLVEHRKRRGITQKEVAAAMETTQSTVSDFERLGGDPRMSTIMRYARAVGMAVHTKAHVVNDQPHLAEAWQPVAYREEQVPVAGKRRAA